MVLPMSDLFTYLQCKLFGYFAISLLAILLIATAIESLVLNKLLTLPPSTQQQLTELADEASLFIKNNNIKGLAEWEEQQDFTLFILNNDLQSISQREMHPHFIFKLNYLKQLKQPMGDRVRKPLISVPLPPQLTDKLKQEHQGLTLVVQLNPNLHPAQQLSISLWIIRTLVGLAVLLMFTSILSKYLIKPLKHLQSGTQALASGKLDTRIAQHFSTNEPEFYRLATEFDHMAEQVQQSMLNQQRLLRDVSHELRTPLARQVLALHLLEKRLGGSHPKLLSRLAHENTEMSALINTILNFSRLNSAHITLNIKDISANMIRIKALNDIEFEAKAHQTIIWEQPEDELILKTDLGLLSRAIDNVLRNALKYAGEHCTIIITCIKTPAKISFIITDNGPGIDNSELVTVFNPFTRMDDARHSSQGGYGLGLAIVKKSMQLLGGEAIAENLGSGGLKISLSIPQ
ncbi:histidine kinase sensor domain-containing protein [Shewanella sp. VB17]|nr:histidine kinase sensor domain-containing protein [Shewanella sp. VB17]